MSVSFMRDVGAYLLTKNALNPQVVTTTGDASEKNGFVLDRDDDAGHPYLSAKVIIPYSASLAAAKTATIKSNFQDSSSSGSGFADYDDKDGSTANTVTIGSTGSTAAQTINGTLAYDVDLSAAKRFVRVQVTPTLSAGSTENDEIDIAGVVVLAGGHTRPAA